MRALTGIGQLVTGVAGEEPLVDAAIAWDGDRVVWVGPAARCPVSDAEDVGGRAVIPGLIDCHTHLVFGGWREDEFAARLAGRTYLEIARAGGGIASTVRATREADEDALEARARRALDGMLRLGVTTVEAKSGYGLTLRDELKQLRVVRRLASHPVTVVPTFLGAHIVPPEHRDDRARYVDLVCDTMLPAVAAEGLARSCDVFVEETAFTVEEARRILGVARAHGLLARVHADQLTDGGGALLAAEVGAVSASHLEHASDAGLAAMARAGVIAELLPLASLYTRSAHTDARRLRRAGLEVAVASDFNPGSAPSYHLPLALLLACTLSGLTPREAVEGATRVAARALRLDDRGVLEAGRRADLVVLDAPSVERWLYHWTGTVGRVIVGGEEVVGTSAA